jgi:iron complex transport system substrate-binding protein
VGLDEMSRRSPGLESFPSVGGLFNPDMERIVELRPTLVIAVRSAQLHPALAQLRARGIRVEEVAPYTLEEVLRSFVEISRWVGHEARGMELAERTRSELEALRRSLSGRRRPTTALVVERDPLYVAGAGSFAHELIEAAGGVNVFGDLGDPYPRVSLEVLAERAPEVLLDTGIDPADAASGERAAREFWLRFGWVRCLEVIPRGPLTVPGPDMPEAARLLAARLHAGWSPPAATETKRSP